MDKIREDKAYLVPLCIYTFLFLFFCSKMSPLYSINEWADINVYFNVGKGMFSGMTLYSEIFDHKGPLVFFIYGIGSLLSGNSFIGMFIIQLLAWIISIVAIFYTAKLFLRDSLAFIIALITPLSFLNYTYTGGSAEEMVLLLAVISTYFFTSYFKQEGDSRHKPYYMFVHGVLTAMVFLIKLNLMLFWFFPLFAIFVTLLLKKEYKNFLYNCLAYLAGFAFIFIPILLYFAYNGAISEAYHVYIELNKQYSGTNDYSHLINNGFNKLYREFRGHLIWYIIILAGIFYFPLKYVNTKTAKASIMLSGIATILMIFFPLTFHFYYPLPLLIFVTLGLIVIFGWLEKYIDITSSEKLLYIFTAFILLVAINKKDFFNEGAETLFRRSYPNQPQFVFKDILTKEENPTLLNLAFAEGNALFTTANITPTLKYFFCPNIYYNMYPDIRDGQAKYIENKETEFIIDCNNGFNHEFFQSFEPLKTNYTLIATCEMHSRRIFYLYKRNK